MNDFVKSFAEQKDRPAYVSFHTITEEDKAESLKQGHYVARDVELAHITPAYTKDVVKHRVSDWWVKLEADVAAGRIPREWVDRYKAQYEAWKKGQELPLDGVPIKGWGVISPAEQETLIRMNIRTVEDLAGINDDAIRRIGMGGVTLKNKATAWLAQMNDKGPLTQEMAHLKQENELLKGSVENLTKQIELLLNRIEQPQAPRLEINAADILPANPTHEDLVEAYTKKHGKPPHHRMKDESIIAAL